VKSLVSARVGRTLPLLVAITVLAGASIAGASSWIIGLTSSTHPAQSQATGINPPTGGTATSPTASSLVVSWTAPSSGAHVTGYKVTRNGSAVPSGSGCYGTNASTSCTDTGLATGTLYTYTVSAISGNNWQSTASASFQGTTTSTVTLATSGTHTLTVPAHVTTFSFTMTGAGGGGGMSGGSGGAGAKVAGTITIPNTSSATTFTVIVGGAGGGGSGTTTGGTAGTGCEPGGAGGGQASSGADVGGGGGGSTCIYLQGSPAGTIVEVGGAAAGVD
jgi:hypothetical protein